MDTTESKSPEKKRKRLKKNSEENDGAKANKKTKSVKKTGATTPSIHSFFAKKPTAKPSAKKEKGIASLFNKKEAKEIAKKVEEDVKEEKDVAEEDAPEGDKMDVDTEAAEQAGEDKEATENKETVKETPPTTEQPAVKKAKAPVNDFFKPKPKASPKKKKKPKETKEVASPAAKADKKEESEKEEKGEEAYEEEEEEEEEEDDNEEDEDDEEEEEEKKPKGKKTKKENDEKIEDEAVKEGAWGPGQYGSVKWQKGKPVPYLALAEMFADVEAESSRLTCTKYVSNCYRAILSSSPECLLPAVYLTTASVAPAYEGIEVGIGDFLLVKALAESTGSKTAHIKQRLKDEGDIGVVAERCRANQKTMFPPPPLTVPGVFKTIMQIAKIKGAKSGDTKANLIKKLLVSCRGPEARFMVRCLQGNLRIGLAGAGVIAGLGQAVALTPPNSDVLCMRKKLGKVKTQARIDACTELVKQAYTEVPNFELVISNVLQFGPDELPNKCFLTPGVPVKVMLGKPAKGIKEVLTKFNDATFTIEFKYDGERAQIHMLKDGTVRIYSRNSENNTTKYPDLISLMPEIHDKETTSFIIDCEVVAFCTKEKKILPFQTLSTRKRKDVGEGEVTVQVCLFAFDLIYRNGKSFLDEPFGVRRQELHEHFKLVDEKFQFAQHKDTDSFECIEEFMNLAIKSSCEGLMVKSLDKEAGYVPNKRNWLKVKKDYLDGVGDSLDLVPIAAFYGKGKRTGIFGSFLMACYDQDTEEYQSICKLGTGLSDEDLQTMTKFYKEHLLDEPRNYYLYPENMKPDVWFDSVQVWEVLCADLSVSPVHKAAVGQVHETKGIALRFPRFIRRRPDKTPELATSAEQVAEFYNNQSVIGGGDE